MSKLSSGAAPFMPTKTSAQTALKPNLSAAAAPFTPKVSTPSSSISAAPAPISVSPSSLAKPAVNAVEVAANSGLSAKAAPYSPTRTSPTSKGTPVFPSAPITSSAAASASEGPSAIGQSPKPVSPISADGASSAGATNATSSSSNADNGAPSSPFATSTLVVKTAKPAPSEAPKFSQSWGLICNNHLDPKNYTGVEIRRVGDIEQFWRLWHHVPLFSSKVSTSAGSAYTYHWFKGTIKPSWEDTHNVGGGIMTLPIVSGDRVSYLDAKGKTVIDDAYMMILMIVTGGSNPASSCVNGITIKSRNGVAIDFWLDTTDSEKIKELVAVIRGAITPIDGRFEAEKFAYMSNAQRVQAPPPSTGYKGKAAKVEKKIEFF